MIELFGGAILAVLAFLTVMTTTRRRTYAEGLAEVSAATRPPSPVSVAAALCGEHVSAVAFLALAGLVLATGPHGAWPAVALGGGYLLLATLVVVPLRRSRVYSLSDFAEWRLGHRQVRRVVSVCVMATGWLYLLAQFLLAGQVVRAFTGWPEWLGWAALVAVVLPIVLFSTVGSSTGFQALHFWLVLVALAVPALVLTVIWHSHGSPPADGALAAASTHQEGTLLGAYSLCLALAVGAVGLPQFVARLYGTPEARLTRRILMLVLGLVALLASLPLGYAALGRVYTGHLARSAQPDLVMLLLPGQVAKGALGAALTMLVVAAVALATMTVVVGLLIVIGGTISQCALGGGVRAFRIGVLIAIGVPMAAVAGVPTVAELGAGPTVAAAFQLSAATLSPLLLLGVWWRGLTDVGAAVGMVTGLVTSLACAVLTASGAVPDTALGDLLTYPAVALVPLATAVMVVVSLLTAHRIPDSVEATMLQMHLPEVELRAPRQRGRA